MFMSKFLHPLLKRTQPWIYHLCVVFPLNLKYKLVL